MKALGTIYCVIFDLENCKNKQVKSYTLLLNVSNDSEHIFKRF